MQIKGQTAEHESVIFKFDDIEIELTNQHSSSSYGIPVAVFDGQAYGSGDHIEIQGTMCQVGAIFKSIRIFINNFLSPVE